MMGSLLKRLQCGVDEMLVIMLSWEFCNKTGFLLLTESEVGSGVEREDVEHCNFVT